MVEGYITQLVDSFLISTWAGIVTGVIVSIKLNHGSWCKIIESLAFGFFIFVMLLLIIHIELLNFQEWVLTAMFFLDIGLIFKLFNFIKK